MSVRAPERESLMASAAPAQPAVAIAGLSKDFSTRRGPRGGAAGRVARGRRRRGARARRARPAAASPPCSRSSAACRSRPPGRSPWRAGASAERLAACVLMPQRDLLLPWRSALDNAALALELRRRRAARGAPPGRCELFERFGLGGVRRARARTSCPAGCASASRSRARCSPSGPCCCSTSRSRRSTRSRAPSCRSGCRRALADGAAHDAARDATTSRRRSTSATACSCCRRGRGRVRAELAGALERAAGPRSEVVTSAGVLARCASGRWRRSHEPRRSPRAGLGPAAARCWRCSWPAGRLAARARLGRGLPAARAQRGRPRAGRGPRRCCSPDAWVTAQEVLLGFALALAAGRRDRGRAAPLPAAAARRCTRSWSPRRPCRWS